MTEAPSKKALICGAIGQDIEPSPLIPRWAAELTYE